MMSKKWWERGQGESHRLGSVFTKCFAVGVLIRDQFTPSDQRVQCDQGKPAVTEPQSAVGKAG